MAYLLNETTKEQRIALIKSWIPEDEPDMEPKLVARALLPLEIEEGSRGHLSDDEMWSAFAYLFSAKSKQSASYKYGFLKAILDYGFSYFS